jgi:hypothetical protein
MHLVGLIYLNDYCKSNAMLHCISLKPTGPQLVTKFSKVLASKSSLPFSQHPFSGFYHEPEIPAHILLFMYN